MTNGTVWIGWDPAELAACAVAAHSLRGHARSTPHIRRLSLLELRHRGEYTRETDYRPEIKSLWDGPSDAPMSTEHAITRFFVPRLASFTGWSLFVDGDVLFRSDVAELFALADPRYAVQVVQHPPLLKEGTKKDGAMQIAYPKKNWSSVMLFNNAHPGHRALTLDVLNTWPGRDLHAFKWLRDREIGALPAGWNYLVNLTTPIPDPVHLAHFTEGTPNLPGHADDPFAEEWRRIAFQAGYRLKQPEMVRG